MLNEIDTKKLDRLITEKFPIIYEYKFNGLVLLYGGAIRSVVTGENVKDLDFIILTQQEDQIRDFIARYNLIYTKNAFGGYKITYNDFQIDIFEVDDLLDVGRFDITFLFYDIHKRMLIPFGIYKVLKTRTISEINNSQQGNKKLILKSVKFIKTLTKSNKPVHVKFNRFQNFLVRIKRKINNSEFKKCYHFLKEKKNAFIIVVLLGILTTAISAITPILSGNLIEQLLNKGIKEVIFILILMVILKGTKIVISYFTEKLIFIVKKTMVLNIRKEAFASILDFETSNFNTNNSGSFVNKIKDDSNEIARCFNRIKNIVIKGIGNAGIIIYIIYLNWILGIIILIFSIIIYKIRMIGIKKKLETKRELLIKQEKYTSLLNEMISGIKDIKMLDLKENYKQITIDRFKEVSEIELTGDNYESIYNKISDFVKFVTIGLVLIVGIYLVNINLLSASTLVIIYMYRTNIFSFLDNLVTIMDTSLSFSLACNRIFLLLDEGKYRKERYGNSKITNGKGVIEFKNVTFAYDKINVINNCSFKTEAFDTIAIIGESGAGKTTILNLISKIYVPQKGTILIDNNDINDLSYENIKSNISVVTQDPYLFDMSIKDNLRLVKDDITDEEIKNVCKMVCLDTFIESLPNKYDTVIGEGGTTLSQGQKQRLGIARAIIKNTPIILLDEITSALDKDTGSNIKKLINNIKKNHTIIMVTHDLSMVSEFKVLTLKNGKIIDKNNI